jgi:fructose 1,6-bisphosphate aldolase/phosphatase
LTFEDIQLKVTVSVIKADVGSVGGHCSPHPLQLESCRKSLEKCVDDGTLIDFYVTHAGDDIELIMTHTNGEDSREVHEPAWNAFVEATKVAKEMHLYAAGQDLLSDAFSGNVRGMGPGAAEMSFEERKSEPIMIFMADKTEPSAFNLPFAKVFADPFHTTGLVIDPRLHEGFRFEVVDVIDHRKVVLETPHELHDLLALIGDTSRFAIRRIYSKDERLGVAASISTEKLSLTAGHYVGKDDPCAVVRAQAGLPAVGEVLQPFLVPHLVAGWCRGSHYGPFYPCSIEDSAPTYFDGPPRICALGFQVRDGHLVGMEDPSKSEVGYHEPVDYFRSSVFDHARAKSMEVADYIRRHGPFMPAIVPPEELEYTTRPEVLKKLEPRMQPL